MTPSTACNLVAMTCSTIYSELPGTTSAARLLTHVSAPVCRLGPIQAHSMGATCTRDVHRHWTVVTLPRHST